MAVLKATEIVGLKALLEKKDTATIGFKTTATKLTSLGGPVVINYYEEPLALLSFAETKVMCSKEYRSVSSRDRINQFLPATVQVVGSKLWKIKTPDGVIPFPDDGYTVKLYSNTFAN